MTSFHPFLMSEDYSTVRVFFVCAFCVCVLTNVYKLKGLTCLKFEHGVLNLYFMSGAWMVLGFGWISDLHPPKRR